MSVAATCSGTVEVDSSCYFMFLSLLLIDRMDKDEIVDATCTGGMARFINHCCEPNAYARILSAPDPTAPATADRSADVKHITIIAARDIQVSNRSQQHD